jgi:hypothetical protein
MQAVKCRAVAFTGGHSLKNHVDMLKSGVDVAVCTPGRLTSLRETGNLRLDLAKVRALAKGAAMLSSLRQNHIFAAPFWPLWICCQLRAVIA